MSDDQHRIARAAQAYREQQAPARAAEADQRATAALRFIQQHVTEHGYPPSRAEIAQHLGGLAPSTAQLVIEHLKSKGLVVVRPASPRAITITEAGMKAMTEGL